MPQRDFEPSLIMTAPPPPFQYDNPQQSTALPQFIAWTSLHPSLALVSGSDITLAWHRGLIESVHHRYRVSFVVDGILMRLFESWRSWCSIYAGVITVASPLGSDLRSLDWTLRQTQSLNAFIRPSSPLYGNSFTNLHESLRSGCFICESQSDPQPIGKYHYVSSVNNTQPSRPAAYWQIPLRKLSKQYTALQTPQPIGKYHYVSSVNNTQPSRPAAYWQIPLRKLSKQYTALQIPRPIGKYHYVSSVNNTQPSRPR
ncbi:hypothetical protein PoB_004303400 [Plakobranchus ocellatus]|uniref:Uncharacterized protein n=1 Tax=Plakobranchus ocellatus TaxID=259542 RepID=A0AAV4BDT3_9GAST|nr:hypothetical protein PoB_004303400 [Plakobranchus ocellatus]